MAEKEGLSLARIVQNEIKVLRDEKMKTSTQTTLGELILVVELVVKDMNKPIVFDFDQNMKPYGVSCWRGSYTELAVNYDPKGVKNVKEFLKILKDAIGKEFQGYKGGDFMMGKTTPVWVATDYGDISIADYKGNKEHLTVGVIGISDTESKVIINTKEFEY
jgi:hypothetical protein